MTTTIIHAFHTIHLDSLSVSLRVTQKQSHPLFLSTSYTSVGHEKSGLSIVCMMEGTALAIVGVLAIPLGISALCVWIWQEKVLFNPRRVRRDSWSTSQYPQRSFINHSGLSCIESYEQVQPHDPIINSSITNQQPRVHCLLIHCAHESRTRRLAIYCHGNAGWIDPDSSQVRLITNAGWDCLQVEYRGFGKNQDLCISEETMHNDVYIVAKRYANAYDCIGVIGRSIGTGVAAFLTTTDLPVDRCILISPYTNMQSLMNDFVGEWLGRYVLRWLLRYQFPTDQHLSRHSNCSNIVLIHGDVDDLIDVMHSKQLHQILGRSRTSLCIVPGGTHNLDYEHDQRFRHYLCHALM